MTDTRSSTLDTGSGTTRRQMFAGAAGICMVGVGLAACGGSESTAATPAGDAAATTAAEGSSGTVVAALADVPVGGAVSATIAGKEAILAQPEAGTVKAFSATCPHQGAIVAPKGDQLVCPLHNSIFDEATGEKISGPANKGLTEIAVSVDGDNIVTA